MNDYENGFNICKYLFNENYEEVIDNVLNIVFGEFDDRLTYNFLRILIDILNSSDIECASRIIYFIREYAEIIDEYTTENGEIGELLDYLHDMVYNNDNSSILYGGLFTPPTPSEVNGIGCVVSFYSGTNLIKFKRL